MFNQALRKYNNTNVMMLRVVYEFQERLSHYVVSYFHLPLINQCASLQALSSPKALVNFTRDIGKNPEPEASIRGKKIHKMRYVICICVCGHFLDTRSHVQITIDLIPQKK